MINVIYYELQIYTIRQQALRILIEILHLNLLSRLLGAVDLNLTVYNIGSYSVDDRSKGSLGILRACFTTDTTTNTVALYRQVSVEENNLGSEDLFKTRVENNKVVLRLVSTYQKLFGLHFNLKLSLLSKFVFCIGIGSLSVILLT